jgi:hypothetical protein
MGVGFDTNDSAAAALMRSSPLQFVEDLTPEQRATIAEKLARALEAGLGIRAVARDIRSSVVLTMSQQHEVARYRVLLEGGSPEALTVELRDRRFDRSVAAAASGKKPLSAKQIDRICARYRENQLTDRAEFIVSAAFKRVTGEARHRELQACVADLGLRPERVRRVWAGSNCQLHGTMHGQSVGLNQRFTDGEGRRLLYPGDPTAGEEESVRGCRCSVTHSILGPV